ncbi:MAG: T9SS type A sorting domain-containing protein [Bacteroidia bacterium]
MSSIFTTTKQIVFAVLLLLLTNISIAQKPVFLKSNIADSTLKDIALVQNDSYFKFKQNNHFQLWKTNGTLVGTVLVKDSFEFIKNLVNLNNTLYFFAKPLSGQVALYKSDGTKPGTIVIKQFPGTNIELSGLSSINGLAYFSVISSNPNAGSVWKTDGTNLGTIEVKSNVFVKAAKDKNQSFYKAGNSVVFSAYNLNNSYVALWSTNGTSAGTILLKDSAFFYQFSRISNAVSSDSLLVFLDNAGSGGNLWRSNGTKAGTKVIRGGNISSITLYKNEFFYHSGTVYKALNKTDGNSHGPITGLTNVGNAIGIFDNQLVLSGKDNNDWEPYLSNGLAANTVLLKDISNNTNGSDPRYFTKIGNTMYFVANDNIYGDQIWKTNGTTTGTSIVYSLTDTIPNFKTEGLYSGSNYILFVSNNQLYSIIGTGGSSINENLKAKRLLIYPNPTTDKIFIDYEASNQAKIKMYNVLGEEVLSTDFAENISVEFLPKGMYWLQILDGVTKKTEKLKIE